MAVVLGTNAGIVTVAPTTDPTGQSTIIADAGTRAFRVTTTDAVTITEMGWWSSNSSEEANYEVGIYADTGSNLPGALLFSNRTNAKGTDDGWKVVTGLSFELEASTDYWFAVQLDNTSTQSNMDRQFDDNERYVRDDSNSTLQDPFGNPNAITNGWILAIYGLVELVSPTIQGITSITGVQSITI